MANPTENNQSHTEIRRSKDNNIEIEETKKLFKNLRNNFLKKIKTLYQAKILC